MGGRSATRTSSWSPSVNAGPKLTPYCRLGSSVTVSIQAAATPRDAIHQGRVDRLGIAGPLMSDSGVPQLPEVPTGTIVSGPSDIGGAPGMLGVVVLTSLILDLLGISRDQAGNALTTRPRLPVPAAEQPAQIGPGRSLA